MASASAVSVVLVHGGFVDGGGWERLYKLLRKDGYSVSVVQNPTLSLAGDVAATKLVLAAQDRPVIVVGHSYGGVVITEAGTDPHVAALVYIAAFAPDRGESVASLIKDPPPRRPRAADSAAAERLSVSRQDAVPRVLRSGCRRGPRGVSGRLTGPLGSGGARRHDQRARVEDQAELVPRRERGPDDPPGGAAPHGDACRIDRGGGAGQSRDLRVAAQFGGGTHRGGGPGSQRGRTLTRAGTGRSVAGAAATDGGTRVADCCRRLRPPRHGTRGARASRGISGQPWGRGSRGSGAGPRAP